MHAGLVENTPRSSDALVKAAKSKQILSRQWDQRARNFHRDAPRGPLLLHSRSGHYGICIEHMFNGH
jgi:hypothetical protein